MHFVDTTGNPILTLSPVSNFSLLWMQLVRDASGNVGICQCWCFRASDHCTLTFGFSILSLIEWLLLCIFFSHLVALLQSHSVLVSIVEKTMLCFLVCG